MEGTFRTLDESWRTDAHERMKKIAENIAEGIGGTCDFTIKKGYPFLVNEERLTEQVAVFAENYLGKENVTEIDIWITAEDLAYYSQISDSFFYLLGIENKEKELFLPFINQHLILKKMRLLPALA